MARADTILKKKDIVERIRSFEDAIRRASEYPESGKPSELGWLPPRIFRQNP
jgi:hypothetical protein